MGTFEIEQRMTMLNSECRGTVTDKNASKFVFRSGFKVHNTVGIRFHTVKTVTLGVKPIFDDRKLKNYIFMSFSPHRYNPSIMMSSFCRHASRLVICESTSCCHKFTVRFIAVDHLGNDRQPNPGLRPI